MTGPDAAEYHDLLTQFAPRPIRRETDYRAAMRRIDALLTRPKMTRAEEDYLDLLSGLVERWETSRTEIPRTDGIQTLRFLMDEHGLRQRDLVPVFGSEAVTSEVLAGRRRLQAKHIQSLALRFAVSPEAFFPLPETSAARRQGLARRRTEADAPVVEPQRRRTTTAARTTIHKAAKPVGKA